MKLKEIRRAVASGDLTPEVLQELQAILEDPRCIRCQSCIRNGECSRSTDPNGQPQACGLWEARMPPLYLEKAKQAREPYMTAIVNRVLRCRTEREADTLYQDVNTVAQRAMDDVWDHLNDVFDHFPLSDHAFLAAGLLQGYQSILPRLTKMEREVLDSLVEQSTVRSWTTACRA